MQGNKERSLRKGGARLLLMGVGGVVLSLLLSNFVTHNLLGFRYLDGLFEKTSPVRDGAVQNTCRLVAG
jgi:hypothetical protein